MDQPHQPATSQVNNAPRAALAQMIAHQPERHPLVFGFVGAIGTPWELIFRHFRESLQRFDYRAPVVHLARLLDGLGYCPWGDLPDRGEPRYYEERMDAGDRLRAETLTGSAMAALAIRDIIRRSDLKAADSPVAHMLRSLKHPDEVKLLRHVYGSAFFLVGVACSTDERREILAETLLHSSEATADAERLILRDQTDPQNRQYGQNVRDTFAMADVFVPGDSGIDIRVPIDRFLDSVFGTPFLTPTRNEEGMRFAETAALRSAATGRQVGAALVPLTGTPVVAGTNEVPKPGGGQFWTSDSPDYRDFRIGRDPNKVQIKWVVQDFMDRLARAGWLSDSLSNKTGQELTDLAFGSQDSDAPVLKGARVADLIEFARCLHAEQAAIVNAARSGVMTQDAVLYSTTFPCHECAKMIIGAGIAEVHYVEPYPKSLVSRLYRELIDVCPGVGTTGGSSEGKIPFRQFLGIAPRWYEQAFIAGERRIGDRTVTPDLKLSSPRTTGWNQAGVEQREAATDAAISRMLEELESGVTAAPMEGTITEDGTTVKQSKSEAR
jgi:cytidine deaminase